jgi:hypothetical protein
MLNIAPSFAERCSCTSHTVVELAEANCAGVRRAYHCVRGGVIVFATVLVVALNAFTDKQLLAAYALFSVSTPD